MCYRNWTVPLLRFTEWLVVIAGRNESGKVWGGVIAFTFSTVKCHSHYVAKRLGNGAATACSDICTSTNATLSSRLKYLLKETICLPERNLGSECMQDESINSVPVPGKTRPFSWRWVLGSNLVTVVKSYIYLHLLKYSFLQWPYYV